MSKRSWALPDKERDLMLAMRRDLHAHPELSWKERRTSAKVAEALTQMNLKPHTGIAETGVFADIGRSGPMVILRADMDALPIQEETNLPFASKHPGVMHACGHDAHTATLVAVARRLHHNPPKQGQIRLLFQPAEEGAGGATRMLEEGILDHPDAKAIFGLHYWSQMPTGTLSITPGPAMGSVDHLTIRLRGRGGHAAMPQDTRDPLTAGAYLITQLQTLVSRRLDPISPAVITIGKFHAGEAFNVIPEEALLVGTVRTLERKTWEQIPVLIEQIVQGCASSFGVQAEIQLERLQMPLINHAQPAHWVRDVAKHYVEEDQIEARPMLGGEDFSSYLERLPGCFFFVGACADEPKGAAPHHNSHFTLDERAFSLGVHLMEQIARDALKRLCTDGGQP